MGEEIDVYIGQMLDKLEEYNIADNTIVVFTSDHGEMLGAHGMRGKNTFYEESVHVPLSITFPREIPARTRVDEGVSHLDLYATILDYLGYSSSDKSDGTSVRKFIENTSVNDKYDERVVISEWDFRKPVSRKSFDRSLGHETNFMVLKGSYKLMMTKLAEATRLDMMYNMKNDPYEINNLVGLNGDIASDETIGKAEHLKCLLLEWMERMDGPGYYSSPLFSDSFIGPYSNGIKESEGDIIEITKRRKWRELNFWISDYILEFWKPVWKENRYIQNEYIYFGRTTPGFLRIDQIAIIGKDAGLFSVEMPPAFLLSGSCTKMKVTYSSQIALEEVDARIEFTINGKGLEQYVIIKIGGETSTYSTIEDF